MDCEDANANEEFLVYLLYTCLAYVETIKLIQRQTVRVKHTILLTQAF